MSATGKPDVVVIKKYANRRLYDTSASQYVRLDHLRRLVKEGCNFKVVDAKSGEDLTRSVLAQIIFEEESKGETLLPVDFLRQLISLYGDSMQSMVPSYLQMSMDAFASQQRVMRQKMADAMGGDSIGVLEEQARRNMAMFQQAMQIFAPFSAGEAMPENPRASEDGIARAEDVQSLRDELAAMQRKLEQLANDKH